MIQTFFIVLAVIMTISINSINWINNLYLENVVEFKTISNIQYEDFNNLDVWKVTHCEKERVDNWNNLSWYCFYKNDIFIPPGTVSNLNIDIIVKEENWKQKIQKFNNWLMYFENKEIIWNFTINEFEYIPTVTWIESDDVYVFNIEEINNSNWILTNFSFTGWLSDTTSEWMVKDILQKICSNDNSCDGSSNYNGTILNNYIYERDWSQLNINLKNNTHTINNILVEIEDWLPIQQNHYKYQIEPIIKTIYP